MGGPPGVHVWGPKDFSGKRGGTEVRGESGACGGPEALGGLVPLMPPKARFKLCCMRLRIRASLGGATWLHPFPPAMKMREIHASRGGYKFGASLGEATYYFALAFLV